MINNNQLKINQYKPKQNILLRFKNLEINKNWTQTGRVELLLFFSTCHLKSL